MRRHEPGTAGDQHPAPLADGHFGCFGRGRKRSTVMIAMALTPSQAVI
jgi:hypothetical protein